MKTKKIIAVLLAMSLLAVILTACQSDDAPQTNNPAEILEENGFTEVDPEPSHWDILGERNFAGATFTILDANDYIGMAITIDTFAEEMTGEPINDAMYHRDRFIESKYNVAIEYVQMPGSYAGLRVVENSFRAGYHVYDMVISRVLGGGFEAFAPRGIFHNLADAPYLSLQSPWWSKMVHDNLSFNNQLYFTLGDIVPSSYLAPAAMYVNKRLLDDFGIEQNLYDLVFDGKWTLDVLETITRDIDADLNNDGVMHAHDDFFGVIPLADIGHFFAVGVGIPMSTVENGSISIDWGSPRNIQRFNRLTDFFESRQRPIIPGLHDHILGTFRGGRALFLTHSLESGMLFLRDMEDPYGILPMPKFDEHQENYISFISAWVNAFVAIPASANIDKAAFLMEAMGYGGYQIIRPSMYEVTLQYKVSRDSESARAIDIIIESTYLDLNGVYNFGGSIGVLLGVLAGEMQLVSELERRAGAIQGDIDNFIQAMSARE